MFTFWQVVVEELDLELDFHRLGQGGGIIRVPTAPVKPGKMTTVFPVLEKYWNFVILLKILEKWE